MPPSDVLRGYENVLPGGAKRILAMVERQSAHRRRIELHDQMCGFIMAAGIIAAIFLLLAAVLPPW